MNLRKEFHKQIKKESKIDLFQIIDETFWQLDELNLEDITIIACQHLLLAQHEMFFRLTEKWIKPANIHIIWKNYSYNNNVLESLQKNWFNVYQETLPFDCTQSFDNCFWQNIDVILEKIRWHVKDNKIIVLDDGWQLITRLYEKEWLNIIWVVEQTSSWYNKIKNLDLSYKFINIARSNLKLTLESPHIAKHFIDKLLEKIPNLDQKNILIVWAWRIGLSIAWHLKYQYNCFNVTVFDKIAQQRIEKTNLNTALNIHISPESDSFIDYYNDSVKEFDVIIWATWTNILHEDDLIKLWNKVFLASVSSTDREFPSTQIRNNTGQIKSIHSDREYNNVVLLNSWFPLTFQGNLEEVPTGIIQITIAALYAALLEIASDENENMPWPVIRNARLRSSY